LTRIKIKQDFSILQKNIKSIYYLKISQAWEKCSTLTKEQAMQEYLNLYYHITGETKPESDVVNNIIDFDDIDIPEDFETPNYYSSNAKQAQKEINDYLINSSEHEKIIHKLKEKIYGGDVIGVEFLKNFEKENNFDRKIIIKIVLSVDNSGQSLLHIAVDGMNYSAIKALFDYGVGTKLINSTDKFNMTPLHIAAINFDIEIFALLQSFNPDYKIKDSEGKTCLDYLKENDDIDLNDHDVKSLIQSINI
jgi:ankyrin repeat protein